MRRYLLTLWNALLGRCIIQEVLKVPFTKEHIKELQKVFPYTTYKVGDSLESLAYKAGKQAIIDYLNRTLGCRLGNG